MLISVFAMRIVNISAMNDIISVMFFIFLNPFFNCSPFIREKIGKRAAEENPRIAVAEEIRLNAA